MGQADETARWMHEVHEASDDYSTECHAVKFFSKLNKFIFGYFNPVNIFFDSKNK